MPASDSAASPADTIDMPVPLPPSPAVRASALTDIGRVRESNEDHFLIAELTRTLWVRETNLPQPATQHGSNRGYVFLVADGMGGPTAGTWPAPWGWRPWKSTSCTCCGGSPTSRSATRRGC